MEGPSWGTKISPIKKLCHDHPLTAPLGLRFSLHLLQTAIPEVLREKNNIHTPTGGQQLTHLNETFAEREIFGFMKKWIHYHYSHELLLRINREANVTLQQIGSHFNMAAHADKSASGFPWTSSRLKTSQTGMAHGRPSTWRLYSGWLKLPRTSLVVTSVRCDGAQNLKPKTEPCTLYCMDACMCLHVCLASLAQAGKPSAFSPWPSGIHSVHSLPPCSALT